jgi:TolB protein
VERGLRQLTNDPAQDGFPSWHPDGHSILFSRYGRDVAPEKTGLWLVSPDGAELRRLTTIIGEHPDWSPDGRYIVFDGDFGNAIRLVSASGGTPVRIVPEWIPVERGGQPRWSPDGTRVAFKEGAVLWVLELATGRFEKIFSEPSKRPIPTGWSADGSEIFVWLLDDETRRSDLWAAAAAGGSKRQVASEAEAVYRYADLSPDGTLLAVVRCEGRSACDIWIMAPTGGPRVQITSHPGYEDGPSWSPDGTKIAFVSTRSGNFDIWTVDVDVERVRRELARLGAR